jgi:hypothetical protein
VVVVVVVEELLVVVVVVGQTPRFVNVIPGNGGTTTVPVQAHMKIVPKEPTTALVRTPPQA